MFRTSPTQVRRRSASSAPQLEPLESRTHLAAHAVFLRGPGLLAVFGDDSANDISVGRNAAGTIVVNGGAVHVFGGTPTVANTRFIRLFGFGGNDQLALDETGGALPKATLFGGAGDDVLTGGSGPDLVFGEAGNDFLIGKGGTDFLAGGAGGDTLTGGADNDQVFGQAGDDHLAWNPGDGSDVNEGGAGNDQVLVNGAVANEVFNAIPNGDRVRFNRTDPTPFSLDIGSVETLFLRTNAGDDTFTGANGLAPLIHLTIDGGVGNDTLTGSDGADDLLGRDGNDVIDGRGGNDLVLMGDGDDVFTWNPGDGSDTVDGQNGNDAMVFNGSNLAENIAVSANGTRARVSRDLGNIVMDVNGLERVDVNALGGADTVTVNDLSGTELTAVNTDVGPAADGAADAVVVNGTDGNDTIDVRINPVTVSGLHALVTVANAGFADSLTVNAGAGDDEVNAANAFAFGFKLIENGGAGNDTLVGSRGDDALNGGDGNDFFIGFRGSDTLAGGAGDDTFEWDPGDGSDRLEGQAGHDTMLFIGSNDAEGFDLSANGNRARLVRTVAGAPNVTMDVSGVEQVDLPARGGADTVVVNDLTATDVTLLNLDLDGGLGTGAGDDAFDSVTVNGTAGDDTVQVAAFDNNRRIAVGGLFPFVNIAGSDGSIDRLTINTLGGVDAVDAASLPAGLIGLTLVGGAANDVLVGSAGADTFVWNPGDGSDRIEGQGGRDTLTFNDPVTTPETIELSANGPRLRLARQAGNIVMDVDDVEQVNVFTGHASNTVTVDDLAGTDVTGVSVNIDPNPGDEGGGFPVGRVIVNGSAGADRVQVAGSGHGLSVTGLAATVVVNAVHVNDILLVNALGGDDVVDASALQSGVVGFALDGGAGNDTLRGSQGGDIIVGRAGSDTVFMGAGDDGFVWNAGDGSDVVEGEAGRDMLSFNGSDDAETFGVSAGAVSAGGNRVRLTRDRGNVTMDVGGVERLDLSALGGADKVVANDLAGTDVGEINVSLSAESGGNAGDGQVDSVVVNGNDKGELIPVLGTAGGIMVNGGFAEAASLPYVMVIRAVDPADVLQVNGNGGNDSIDATGLQTPVKFRAEGGAGDDILRGSAGDDVLLGGDGEDGIDGNGGADSAFLGAGNDIFVWDPGDGSDLVEGQDGADTLVFRGANTLERFDLAANGDRLRLTRSPGNVAMDVNDVERVDVIAQGGPDNIFVNDLAGTDVVAVNISLGAGGGPNGDQLADAVSVSGSAGADRIVVTDVAGVLEVIRPSTLVRITGADPEFDTLTVNGLAGNDSIDATGLTPGIIQLGVLGGEGDDTLLGGPGEDFFDGGFGNDTLTGGAGDDVLIGGPGVDVLDGGPGNNTLIQD